MNKLLLTGILSFTACALCLQPLRAQKAIERGLAAISRNAAQAHIGFLASDELAGREAGSPAGAVAARYLETQLRLSGIDPLLPGGYRQPFEALRCEKQLKGRWEVHPDSLVRLRSVISARFLRKYIGKAFLIRRYVLHFGTVIPRGNAVAEQQNVCFDLIFKLADRF